MKKKWFPSKTFLDLLGYLKNRVFQTCGDFVESENVFPLPDSYNPPELTGKSLLFQGRFFTSTRIETVFDRQRK